VCLVLVFAAALLQWLAARDINALLPADVAVLAVTAAVGYGPP